MEHIPDWLVFVYLAVLVAVAVLPLYTFFRGTFHLGKMHKQVVQQLIDEKKTKEAKEFLQEFTGKNSLNKNSTRVTLALVLFVILGLMTIHIILFGGPEDAGANDAFRTVFAMVASLLSAVVGFYFGGRSTEKAVAKAMDAPGLEPEELLDRFIHQSDAKMLEKAAKKLAKKKRELTA